MSNEQNVQKAMVGGQKVPPPATQYNTQAIASNGTSIHALLHQVFAFCGRAFLFMLFALPFFAVSCSQDDANVEPLTPMHQMYDESVNLTQATVDSISCFCVKFSNYVTHNPQSKQDEYYEPTIHNVRTAAALHGYGIKVTEVTTGISLDTDWEGEFVYTFE